MDVKLDITRLRDQLESRFGLALTAGFETVDGGIFPAIRPADIETGNGFCVAIARTPRQIEASFHPDSFSAGLLRRMADADEGARRTFAVMVEQARSTGAHVYVAVNGSNADMLLDESDLWRKLEIEVVQRLGEPRISADGLAQEALGAASVCLSLALSLLPVEEVDADQCDPVSSLPEGGRMRIEVNRYERSPANRAACIAYYGTTCQACGFNFVTKYGDLGEGYIEVHHRVPVSTIGADYFVNPITDLVPLCANCHAMAHRQSPPLEVDALKSLIQSHAPRLD